MPLQLNLNLINTAGIASSEFASSGGVSGANSRIDVVQGNAASFASYANATFSTVSGGDPRVDSVQDNLTTHASYANSTFATTTYVDTEVANLVNGAPGTLDTLNELAAALGNDANLSVTLTTKINTISSNTDTVETNLDTFGTYSNTTFATDSDLNTVSSNVDSVSHGLSGANTNIDTVSSNVDSVSHGLTGANANIDAVTHGLTGANTNIGVVQGNVDTFASYANTTFATSASLGNVDAVQSNADSFASYANTTFSTGSGNTQLYISSNLVSNTALFLEAGNGVSITGNTTSHVVTITTNMSNITSQVIATDGTANSFGLIKSAANANMLLVSLNGLLLNPQEYTISSTTLTLSNSDPIVAGSNVEVRLFDFFDFPGLSTSSGGGSPSSPHAQGSSFGYVGAGVTPSNTQAVKVEKYSFTSDANATDLGGDLRSTENYQGSGASSSTHGYVIGGRILPSSTALTTVEKFVFASDTSGGDGGELATGRKLQQSTMSTTHAYVMGGLTPTYTDNMEKFPFASDTTGSSIGTLVNRTAYGAAAASTTHGYIAGGFENPATPNTSSKIEKTPFSSDTNATDVGELSQARYFLTGSNSDTHGYVAGGLTPTAVDTIDKYPFSSDSGATDVGELFSSGSPLGGGASSSTTHGYQHKNGTIEKYSFSSDSSATDVGETVYNRHSTGSAIQV